MLIHKILAPAAVVSVAFGLLTSCSESALPDIDTGAPGTDLTEMPSLRSADSSINQPVLVPASVNVKEIMRVRKLYSESKEPRSNLYAAPTSPLPYDPILDLHKSAVEMNFYALGREGARFSISPKSSPNSYLTSGGLKQLLYFQVKKYSSKSQEFDIRSYSVFTGLEHTIHNDANSSASLGDGVLPNNSDQHYVCLFPVKTNDYYLGRNWRLEPDEYGYFKIVNLDSFYQGTSSEVGIGALTYKVMEIGNNNRAELNAKVENDSSRERKQSFKIKANQSVSIFSVEYIDEGSPETMIQKLSDDVYERSYLNTRDYQWSETVEFTDFYLMEESNYEEYTGITFDVTNRNTISLKTPEVFNGELQEVPSVNSEPVSRYRSRQTIRRQFKDVAFRFDIPAKSRVTIRYSIPRYRVKCPYKLTLTLDSNPNVELTVYGYWTGIVHSIVEAEDPELITEAIDSSLGTAQTAGQSEPDSRWRSVSMS